MKEVLLALAKYNRGVNLNLIDVLSKASPEVLSKETGTYYKTILGTIHHCFWYEVVWLKRYKALGDYPSLSAPILAEEVEAIKAGAGNDWAKLSTLMKEIDSLFVAFAQEVKAEDLLKPIKFKNYKGEERSAWPGTRSSTSSTITPTTGAKSPPPWTRWTWPTTTRVSSATSKPKSGSRFDRMAGRSGSTGGIRS